MTDLQRKAFVLLWGLSWIMTSFTPRIALKEPSSLGGREVHSFVMDFVHMNVILYAYVIVFMKLMEFVPTK